MPIIVHADFNNLDESNRVRLCTEWIHEGLEDETPIEKGLQIEIHDGEEFITSAVLEFSEKESGWVAVLDWDNLRPIPEHLRS